MEKQTKITYLLAILLIFVFIFQKEVFKFEDPASFILIFPFAFGFVLSVIQNTFSYIRKSEPKDLWKLGFIAFFGLIGLLPGFSYGFFGLFGLIGFFGAKSWKTVKEVKNETP
jgi:hypothetical protein